MVRSDHNASSPPNGAGRGDVRTWLALALALSLLHNFVGWLGVRRWGHIDAGYRRVNLVLLALIPLAALLPRFPSRREIGWTAPTTRGALAGLLTGLALGLPPALAFCFPIGVRSGPIQFSLIGGLTGRGFAWKVLVELPVVTAIWEELAYRGILEGGLRRYLAPVPAALVSAVAFTLGHGAVHHHSLNATNLGDARLPRPLVVLGCMLSVYAGGLIFSRLRAATGSLWPAVLAHWAVDAVMLATFFVLGRCRNKRAMLRGER